MDFHQPQKKINCLLCGCDCQNNVCVDLGECGDSEAATEKQRHYTLKKLARLNISAASDEPWLPTTVCFVCEKRLSDAYEFVLQAERAREALHLLYKENLKIVSEKCDNHGNDKFETTIIIKSENSEFETNFSFDQEYGVKYVLIEAACSKIETDNIENNCTVDVPQDEKEETTNEIGSITFHSDDDIVKTTECTVDVPHNEKEEITNEIESRFFASDDEYEEKFEPLTYTWADYTWSCLFCVNQFPTFEEFREHSITQHNVCNAYECAYCEKGLHSFKLFLKHVRRHNKNLIGNCYHCRESNINSSHFNIHKSEFMCPGCKTCFNNPEEKSQHVKQYYISTNTPYTPLVRRLSDNLTCRSCKKTYKTKTALQSHIITIHNTEHNTLCDICGEFTPPGPNFKLHVNNVHTDQSPICKICNITFSTKSSLRSHVVHHSDTYLYFCNECGKGYKGKSGLKSHIESHNDKGIRRYKCPECPKTFRRKPGLRIHLRQHTGEKPYDCSECDKSFVNVSNLGKHMKRIHKVEVVPKKLIVVVEQETEDIAKWKEEVFKKRYNYTNTKFDFRK